MEAGYQLKSLLQFQLASDASTVKHLPYCLSSLTPDSLLPSSHLAKWTTRIQVLLHSKESGARWAGFCLAYKTALLSQSVMIDSAQSWIGIALPVLSRNEPTPTLKAAIRLLRVIFTSATDIPEFQRQLSVPNIVKFTSAIIPLADNHLNIELKVLIMETLTRLVALYPTTHRASYAVLSGFSLRYLNGSPISPTNCDVMNAASRLYSVLHLTGGKVGAINLWRKSLDETLSFGWEAFFSLRSTFPIEDHSIKRAVSDGDPQIIVPLNLDRLHCTVIALCNLLSTIVQRPVQVPLGNLIKFITALLSCSETDKIDGFIDPLTRSMELSVVPDVCISGCDLLIYLTQRFPFCLDAHSSRLLPILAYQLEQKPHSLQRLSLLKAVDTLLKTCHPIDSSILPNRLAKSVLPLIAKVVSATSDSPGGNEATSSKTKNGKKRVRNYEGDEVFRVSRDVVCPTAEEGEALLVSIDVLQSLFTNPNLSSAMRSVIARIIISILLALPRMSPSSLSQDPSFIQLLNTRVQSFGIMVSSGTTSAMSKALPFVIGAALTDSQSEMQSSIELLLHPRVPPLVRSMPHLESLSLFKAEESHEEAEMLSSLVTENMHSQSKVVQEDVAMKDITTDYSSSVCRPTHVEALAQPKDKAVTTNTLPPLSPHQSRTEEPAISSRHQPQQNIQMTSPQPVAQVVPLKPMSAIASNEPITSLEIHLPIPLSAQEEDEDEKMPTIDMDSDSEVEED